MGVVTRTHAGGTAYGSHEPGPPAAPRRPRLGPVPEGFSHPGPVPASPPGARPARPPPLAVAAPGPGAAGPDLGHRREPGRALRDRQGLRRRRPAQAPPPRPDRARL